MLISHLLNEAKIVQDYRHANSFDKLEYWPKKDDPKFIDPKDGFHFTYHKGKLVLHSTENIMYSGAVALDQIDAAKSEKTSSDLFKQIIGDGGDVWNKFSGMVDFDNKTITISKESAGNKMRQRDVSNIKEIKDAFKNLFAYGVKFDFRIKGVAAPFNGMTVEEFMKQKDLVNVLDEPNSILFHGTSISRWQEIQKRGIRAGQNGNEAYVDLIPGYSEENVYLGTSAKVAEFYGKRQAKKDGDEQYVVLQITVPDTAKLRPDDHFARRYDGVNLSRDAEKKSIRELGSIAYRGNILPKFIKLLSTKKA